MSQSESFRRMDANMLVEALVKHEDLLPIKPNFFYTILMANDFEMNATDLYYPLNSPNNRVQRLSDNAFISIDGLIMNLRAKNVSEGQLPHYKEQYEPCSIESSNPWNNFWDKLGNKLTHKYCDVKEPYPTYEMMESLIHNPRIIELMMSSPNVPFTLLGRFYSYEGTGEHEGNGKYDGTYVFTRPVLVKPGIDPEFDHIIYRWERANTKIEKGKEIFERLK